MNKPAAIQPGSSFRARFATAAFVRMSGAAAFVDTKVELAGLNVGDDTVMRCDVAVLHDSITEQRLLSGHERALAIEVAEATSARDPGLKRLACAGCAIAYYRVVDGERSVVHMVRNAVAGGCKVAASGHFREPLTVPGIDAKIVID